MREALVAAAIALVATPALAHHSAAMFDQSQTLEVKAEIKEFQWTNPHVWIQINVPNAAGTDEEWSVEGGGRNSLAREGWRPGTFKPGDVVTMKLHPMRDGSHGAQFVGAKLADGTTIGRW
ncbi:MAG TPA: DUF6152 family protein [Gammaproteobacteria bacterium]|nr:DUF6152 family protein [Gammaproteobacteria bacterium]